MAEKTYNIVVTGSIADNVNREEALAAFAETFKLPRDKAEAMLDAAPKIIKAGLAADKAKVYLATLKKIGIAAKAEPVTAPGKTPPSTETGNNSEPLPDDITEPRGPAAIRGQAKTAADTTRETSASVYEPENPPGLKFRIEGKPDYSFLTVQIPANETIKVEASAMATMDTNIKMKTKLKGGFGRFLTGENLFINEFTADQLPGEIGIAPGTPGDLTHRHLNGDTIFLQNSAYVASTMDVAVETKWQGLVKGFFSGESLFLIRCSGTGDLWFNTYGAIIEIDVNGGYVVDTGNIVAFTEGLEYDITKVGGYKSLFFSGEGFVCRFSGSGKVWIQTRSASAFTHWAHFYRPIKKKS